MPDKKSCHLMRDSFFQYLAKNLCARELNLSLKGSHASLPPVFSMF